MSEHALPPDGRAFKDAVLNGVGDPAETLRQYLEEAEPRLAELLWRVSESLEPDDLNFLWRLQGALIALLFSSRKRGGLYRIKFSRRPGNQARTLDEEESADLAAIEAMSAVAEGDQQARAIAEAEEKYGVNRREIIRRIGRFRRIGTWKVPQKP